jgi:hypothetical protein
VRAIDTSKGPRENGTAKMAPPIEIDELKSIIQPTAKTKHVTQKAKFTEDFIALMIARQP